MGLIVGFVVLGVALMGLAIFVVVMGKRKKDNSHKYVSSHVEEDRYVSPNPMGLGDNNI